MKSQTPEIKEEIKDISYALVKSSFQALLSVRQDTLQQCDTLHLARTLSARQFVTMVHRAGWIAQWQPRQYALMLHHYLF